MSHVTSPGHEAPVTSLEVRDRLVEALNLDLIGPWLGHDLASERLPGWVRPSNWYLSGFLVPAGAPPARSADPDEDDDLDEMPGSAGLAEESTEERKAAKKGFFPSSMGLSFLVPGDSESASVSVRWADYGLAEAEGGEGKPGTVWQREQRERTVPVSLVRADEQRIEESGGLWLHTEVRTIDTARIAGIPTGTRAVSVFLVNRRQPDEDNPDRAYAFQAEIEVWSVRAFVPRRDPRGAQAEDWDDQVADLHYADTPGYATGHGVSGGLGYRGRRLPEAPHDLDPERRRRENRDCGSFRGRALDGEARRTGGRRGGGDCAAVPRRSVPGVDRRAAGYTGSAPGWPAGHGGRAAAPSRPRRGPNRAGRRPAGEGRRRARCVPGGEPGGGERAPPAPRRALRRGALRPGGGPSSSRSSC